MRGEIRQRQRLDVPRSILPYGQRDIFNPYEKHHSTVKDASELAENLGVKNLVLYHTEDKNIKKRKELYGAEGREYYHGNLFIPDDLDVIEM